jgi:hypothetical protein
VDLAVEARAAAEAWSGAAVLEHELTIARLDVQQLTAAKSQLSVKVRGAPPVALLCCSPWRPPRPPGKGRGGGPAAAAAADLCGKHARLLGAPCLIAKRPDAHSPAVVARLACAVLPGLPGLPGLPAPR